MTRNARKNKNANDNHRLDNTVFTSPDGIPIQINRGGNKMQFIRDLCRNKEITDVQFRMLVPLVDTSNEGTDDDRSRWGKSWLSLAALALESGCSKKAIQNNMPLLEAAGIVKVKRDLTDDGRSRGGRSNVNEYWLSGWNTFGALSGKDEKGEHDAPFEQEKGGTARQERGNDGTERGNGAPLNGAHGAPDSTYLHNQEHNSSTQPCASRRERPVDDVVSDRPQPKPGNDNDPEWPSPNEAVAKFLEVYPKGGSPSAISDALETIRKERRTKFADILRGASNYSKAKAMEGTAQQFVLLPVNFLTKAEWMGYQKTPQKVYRKAYAI